MKIDVLNIDDFIKGYKVKEVSDSRNFQPGGEPTEEGLFSYDIFGNLGTEKRRTEFGYIDLHMHFIHPVIYKSIQRFYRNIDKIVSGVRYVSIDDKGYLVDDDKNGHTGLEWLYKNWDNIKWQENDSSMRKLRLDILKTERDKIWIDKWIVSPAGPRDFSMKGPAGHQRIITETYPVNNQYGDMLRLANSMESESFQTQFRIQMLLVDIYNYYMGDLKGKTGMIQNHVQSKTIDYATRSVITAPKIQSSSPDSMLIKFGYIGVPLGQLTVLFYPFFQKWIKDWAEEYEEQISIVGEGKDQHEITNVLAQFDDTHVRNMLDSFTEAPEERFNPINILDDNGKAYPVRVYKEDLGRYLTMTDLVYIAAVDVCEDKHIAVTRYPVENIQNINISRIKILSTINVKKQQKLSDKYLFDYPVIVQKYPTENISNIFYDTIVPSNNLTGSFGVKRLLYMAAAHSAKRLAV